MALRLQKYIGAERRVGPLYGVSIWFRPITLAGWHTAQARAERLARERAPEAAVSALEAAVAQDEATESELTYRDKISGLAHEIFLTALVEEHAIRWEGVEDENGNPVPLSPETWSSFIRNYPMVAEQLMGLLQLPFSILAAEGNGSGLSRNGQAAGAEASVQPAPTSRTN